MTDITTIGVLGGGLMGSGIAQVAAQAGFTTIVREVSEALADRARDSIARTVTTSDAAVQSAFAVARRMGKEPVAAKDVSGFIVNRLLVPYLLDAIRALETGVGSVVDIDAGMQLGTGHPMGPFTLLDFVGLDTVYKIAEIMFAEYRDSRYAPPPLLKRMVLAGMLGRKSGKGFYDYSSNPPRVSNLGL